MKTSMQFKYSFKACIKTMVIIQHTVIRNKNGQPLKQ